MYKVTECLTPHYFISWGKGLQSTTLGVLAALGEIKVDALFTAETGWEHPHTYEIEKYYTKFFLDHNLPVYKCQEGDIHQEDSGSFTRLPLWTSKGGAPLKRQCTGFYKITPIRRKMREILGLRLDNKGRTLRNTVILYLGISYDECERMKESDRNWIKNEFPLVDRKWSREDCIKFLTENNLPVPKKSSCVICPYKGINFWRETKELYPEEFQKAIEFDRKIRVQKRMIERGYDLKCYITKTVKPLEELDVSIEDKSKEEICDTGYCFI